MPANVEKVTRVTTVTVIGIVENEPQAPQQFSKDRRFLPSKVVLNFVSVDLGPWSLRGFTISGPAILTGNRLSSNWKSWKGYGVGVSPEEHEHFPWLASLIEENQPKTG